MKAYKVRVQIPSTMSDDIIVRAKSAGQAAEIAIQKAQNDEVDWETDDNDLKSDISIVGEPEETNEVRPRRFR